ncbi:ABC transporter ATP-binding protein [Rhodospira trueperi]|uniref:Lipopolysaccharide transport system ATP-binding protein n=1 Tax=Rhodospira trueperi TaxID=69960 RepID=A0A1G7GPJ7_9PROT|nr:ABC transporter ATP-binding protein [Rhodospira trueperi]SDE90070.1 lipopolysaccharide transport system ATP-binding protein [Rhodospira trueperi]
MSFNAVPEQPNSKPVARSVACANEKPAEPDRPADISLDEGHTHAEDETPEVIRVDGLWKSYGLPFGLSPLYWAKRAVHRLRGHERGLGPGPFAIQDLSFSLRRGETLGIMGRNGSGKSTLLKVLSGVSPPTAGDVRVSGRLFPMIELNAGLNPDLNGLENARTLSAIMGLSQTEIAAKMPEIEAFCELDEWFRRPVRTYSSGMMARLGFAVAMHVDADVLLIDEVLAVGDFAFQKKCISAFSRLRHAGVTTVFVSHNPYMIERMCDRVIVLQEGRTVAMGDATEAVAEYFRINAPKTAQSAQPSGDQSLEQRSGTGDMRVTKIEVLDLNDRPLDEVRTMEPLKIRLHCSAREPIHEPNFGLRFVDENNTVVLSVAFTNHRRGVSVDGRAVFDCTILEFPLLAGRYAMQVKVTSDILLDMIEIGATLNVKASDRIALESAGLGFVYTPIEWAVDDRPMLRQR